VSPRPPDLHHHRHQPLPSGFFFALRKGRKIRKLR
jgi:hypothetical protein